MKTEYSQPAAPRPLQVGDRLGPYRLVSVLAVGGMGMVFKAYEEVLDRYVAVKVLAPQLADDPAVADQFLAEARTVASLNHPNIVQIYSAGQQDGAVYFVMELLDGPQLETLRKERRQVPPREAVELIRQAALGLQRAHEHGIVHGDVKPANLIVNQHGVLKVADFGLAQFRGAPAAAAATEFFGTPEYISPEAIQGAAVDHRSDIYSLGATLYYLLAGRPPFTGLTPQAILQQHLTGTLPQLSQFNAHVPPALERLVGRMMARRPDDRFPDYAELIAALDHWLTESAAPPGPLPAAKRRSKSVLPIVAPVVTLVMCGLGVWLWGHVNRSTPPVPVITKPAPVSPPPPVEDLPQQAQRAFRALKQNADGAVAAGQFGQALAIYQQWPAARFGQTPAAAAVAAECTRIREQSRQAWAAALKQTTSLLSDHKFDEAARLCDRFAAANEGIEDTATAAANQQRVIEQAQVTDAEIQRVRAAKLKELHAQLDPLILNQHWSKARELLAPATPADRADTGWAAMLAPLHAEVEALFALRAGILGRLQVNPSPVIALSTTTVVLQGRLISFDDEKIRIRQSAGTVGFAETTVAWTSLPPASVDKLFRSCLVVTNLNEVFGYAVLVTHQVLARQVPVSEARLILEGLNGLDQAHQPLIDQYLQQLAEFAAPPSPAPAQHPAHVPLVPGETTLVIWNANGADHHDRGTKRCNVILFRGDREVWRHDNVELEWSADRNSYTAIPLPAVLFDKVRIEVTEYHRRGGGLAEVVLQGDAVKNLRPVMVTASTTLTPTKQPGRFAARKVIDGLTSSQTYGEGYWLLPNATTGWIEIVYAREQR